jgi:DNA-directed RNA polymerase specialized sigma24 family protein
MDEHESLAERFEEHRTHLRAVAYRMLGSLSEADDAVQEAGCGSAAPRRAVSRTWADG